MHFICIDKRVTDNTTQRTYVIMDNGEKIIMPENVQSVPAMMLLNEKYRVLYGDDIYAHIKPRVTENVKKGTDNNMEPTCFSFQGESTGLGVMSDSFSFLDTGSDDLGTKGSGGLRQMYNYVGLNETGVQGDIQTPTDDFNYNQSNGGSGQEMTIEQLQQIRDDDFRKIAPSQGI